MPEENELELVTKAMYIAHSFLQKSEAGEKVDALFTGLTVGASGPSAVTKDKLKQSGEALKNATLNEQIQKYGIEFIETLENHKDIESVNSMLEELYKVFPKLKVD